MVDNNLKPDRSRANRTRSIRIGLMIFMCPVVTVIFGPSWAPVLGSHDEFLRWNSRDALEMSSRFGNTNLEIPSQPPAVEFGSYDWNDEACINPASATDHEEDFMSRMILSLSEFLDQDNEISTFGGENAMDKSIPPTAPGTIHTQENPKMWKTIAFDEIEREKSHVNLPVPFCEIGLYNDSNCHATRSSTHPIGQEIQTINLVNTHGDQIQQKIWNQSENPLGSSRYPIGSHYGSGQHQLGTHGINPKTTAIDQMENHVGCLLDEAEVENYDHPKNVEKRVSYQSQLSLVSDSYMGVQRTPKFFPHFEGKKSDTRTHEVWCHMSNSLGSRNGKLQGMIEFHSPNRPTNRYDGSVEENFQMFGDVFHNSMESCLKEIEIPHSEYQNISEAGQEYVVQPYMHPNTSQDINTIVTKETDPLGNLLYTEAPCGILNPITGVQRVVEHLMPNLQPDVSHVPNSSSELPLLNKNKSTPHPHQDFHGMNKVSRTLMSHQSNPRKGKRKKRESISEHPKQKDSKISKSNYIASFKSPLYEKGVLEMGAILGFSERVSAFFTHLHQMMMSANADTPDEVASMFDVNDQLRKAFETAKHCLVKHYFGGIALIYEINRDCITKQTLMEEGMLFLLDYFSNWSSIPSDLVKEFIGSKIRLRGDHSSPHERLLHSMMENNLSRRWSFNTIVGLLTRFSQYFREKNPNLILKFDSNLFSAKCQDLHTSKNDKMLWLKFGWESATLSDTVQISKDHVHHGGFKGELPEIDNNQFKRKNAHEIIRYGTDLIHISDATFQKISAYFISLKYQWRDECRKMVQKRNSDIKTRCQNQTGFQEQHIIFSEIVSLIEHATSRAQQKITPAFMYMVQLYHQHAQPFPSLDESLINGRRFLEEYFSTWKRVVFMEETPKYKCKDSGRPPGFLVDWSNTRDVVYYFSTEDTKSTPPCTFARYLVKKWDIYLASHKDQTEITP